MVGRCSQVLDHKLLGRVTGRGSRVAGRGSRVAGRGSRVAGYFGGSRFGVTVRGSQASVVGSGS